MRQFTLFSLIFAVVLTCCGGCTVQFRDQQGRALDRPYGPEKVVVEHPFVQQYPGWVAISVDGGPAIEVPYGKLFPTSSVSQKYFSYKVFWAEWVGYDQKIRGQENTVVGLYTGQPIVIDEAFLRGVPFIEIVVCNEGSESTYYSDSQGNSFTLQPSRFKELRVATGPYKLTWRPSSGQYTGESLRACKNLTLGKKIFYNEKFYEDRLFTYRSIPNWEDFEQMRSHNGCMQW